MEILLLLQFHPIRQIRAAYKGEMSISDEEFVFFFQGCSSFSPTDRAQWS